MFHTVTLMVFNYVVFKLEEGAERMAEQNI